MKVTPVFIVASLLCATPFALAVRQDLNRKDRGYHDPFDDHDDDDDYSYGDSDRDREREAYREAIREAEAARAEIDTQDLYVSRDLKPSDLGELFGTEPASMGPILDGLTVGASSLNFQSEASRARIEGFKEHKEVAVEFDFDEVSLNGIELTIEGPEEELREALVDRWGTPRRGGEDELVWLGADQTRAVYSARYDGFVLKFEKYATLEEIIAPADKTKLGFEPYPIIGGSYAKLEAAMGAKFQPSDDEEGHASFVLPGIGAGAGRTMVRVGTMGDRPEIRSMVVEGATYDSAAVHDALIAKWGKPTAEYGTTLTWRKKGVEITADFYDEGFTIQMLK